MTFRFCMAHAPAEADSRSVDGFLSCRQPYIDAHLADIVPHQEDRWDYIHRSDTRYAQDFPLAGLFRRTAEGLEEDLRLRLPFGDHAQVWAPRATTSDVYLAALYGSDWRTALRQRDGPRDVRGNPGIGAVVHNDSLQGGKSFWGLFARPSGPLRDVIGELRALGALERKADWPGVD
mmetsp:Transcript_31751/g.97711  ORF Transcript_31751/g.97711 Transcript_31751/m.97711 type:complete len:177 (+) Transcript_31751:1-531(+)